MAMKWNDDDDRGNSPPAGLHGDHDFANREAFAGFLRNFAREQRVRGKLIVRFFPIGFDRLMVCFLGEDGTGVIAAICGRVTKLEPRATVLWHVAETNHDVGGGFILFGLSGGNPFANRRAVLRLKRRLQRRFFGRNIKRTQIWTQDVCTTAYRVKDQPGLLAALTGVFAELKINLTVVTSARWVDNVPESFEGANPFGTPYCLLGFEMQLPEKGPAFRARISEQVEALGFGGELLFDEDAIRAYDEARAMAGGRGFSRL
jgi:hypothetical protein